MNGSRDYDPEVAKPPRRRRRPPYEVGALLLLCLINIMAMMDRHLLSVVAEDVKLDLNLSDADIGFVYGTGISIFYALFSIPLGRLADVWVRKNVIAICMTASSVMICLTGLSRNFAAFAACRVGVGIGEAGEGPAAMSILSDYFPPTRRSTVLAIWTAGVPIGSGLGIILGGAILDFWATAYPDTALAPFGLKGWQVAFLSISIPGPLIGFLFWNLREPERGATDGIGSPKSQTPFRDAWIELQSVVPILSLQLMTRLGATTRMLWLNISIGLVIVLTGLWLNRLTASPAQWAAIGFGLWSIVCWSQSLYLRDRVAFGMICRSRTLQCSNFGFAALVFVTAGVGAWAIPFMMRMHAQSPAQVGAVVGALTIVFGFIGVIVGGVLSDFLERFTARARLVVALIAVSIALPSAALIVLSSSASYAYASIAVFTAATSMTFGVAPSIANGLVMPRMRGVSSAYYLIVISLFGMGLGPYSIGRISDAYAATGINPATSLQLGILWGLSAGLVAACLFFVGALGLSREASQLKMRASNLGEDIISVPMP